ncbi:MAG: hypothetical protein CMP53_09125 [Flavobacteriales bacterium]|nr:hypothetical protein [Flavobacteriales bacterium]
MSLLPPQPWRAAGKATSGQSMTNKSVTINTSTNGYNKQQVVCFNWGSPPEFTAAPHRYARNTFIGAAESDTLVLLNQRRRKTSLDGLLPLESPSLSFLQ